MDIATRIFQFIRRKFYSFDTREVFPCKYIDCVEKLEELYLSPRESFYSSLTNDTVSENAYADAVNVWQRFSIRTLGEYYYIMTYI